MGADRCSIDKVVRSLKDENVTVAHVGIFDMDGVFRERRLPLDEVSSTFDDGGTFVNVLHQWDTADTVYGPGPFVGESVAVDSESVRPYPFEPDAALLIADYTGPSASTSPRELLKRQIAKAAQMGFDVRSAFEFEFIVLDETAASLREKGFENLNTFAADNRCWSGQSAAIYSDFVRDLNAVMSTANIPLAGLGLELGPGCFEATLKAGPPLKSADDAAFFKLFTKAFCRRRDLTASFMAKLSVDFPGLSGHLHLSLRDKQSDRNAFYDGTATSHMSTTMQSFIAGLVTLTPEALALCAHTANAYRRLVPGNWAPRTATWAVQNYAAAVRAVPEPQARCRLEFRLPAADTNPYLTLAMTLGVGLWGIEHSTALPAPIAGGGPAETPEDTAPLPHDLREAAERLRASESMRAILGDEFIDHFVASRRWEEAQVHQQVSAFERARYIETV
ncbi:MAG: glutamine synthetase family protein [Gammaproteobacteria bacterium]